MRIYSDKARYVGAVDDVLLDDKEGRIIGLAFGRRERRVTSIPYDSIMAIADIVLVRTKLKEPEPVPEPVPEAPESPEA